MIPAPSVLRSTDPILAVEYSSVTVCMILDEAVGSESLDMICSYTSVAHPGNNVCAKDSFTS